MTKYKLEWTLKGTVEVEAEDKYEAMEIAENYTYEKLSDGLKSWHMEVKVPPPCKHEFKTDGGNWIICKKCGHAGRIEGAKP